MSCEICHGHAQHRSRRRTNGSAALLSPGVECVGHTTALTLQIAAVVDSYQGQDPFDGDGYMAKGKCMQMQTNSSKSAILQQYLLAMAAYRSDLSPLRPPRQSKHLLQILY